MNRNNALIIFCSETSRFLPLLQRLRLRKSCCLWLEFQHWNSSSRKLHSIQQLPVIKNMKLYISSKFETFMHIYPTSASFKEFSVCSVKLKEPHPVIKPLSPTNGVSSCLKHIGRITFEKLIGSESLIRHMSLSAVSKSNLHKSIISDWQLKH